MLQSLPVQHSNSHFSTVQNSRILRAPPRENTLPFYLKQQQTKIDRPIAYRGLRVQRTSHTGITLFNNKEKARHLCKSVDEFQNIIQARADEKANLEKNLFEIFPVEYLATCKVTLKLKRSQK